MTRPEGWRERLAEYVARSEDLPFVRGQNCCALWVIGAVDEMLGESFSEGICGAFSTVEGASALMAGRGWGTLCEALVDVTGATRLPKASDAKAGDVLFAQPLADGFEFGSLFISCGQNVVGRDEGQPGVVKVPLRQMLTLPVEAYRV